MGGCVFFQLDVFDDLLNIASVVVEQTKCDSWRSFQEVTNWVYTPENQRLEPENTRLEKEKHLYTNHQFLGSKCLFSRLYKITYIHGMVAFDEGGISKIATAILVVLFQPQVFFEISWLSQVQLHWICWLLSGSSRVRSCAGEVRYISLKKGVPKVTPETGWRWSCHAFLLRKRKPYRSGLVDIHMVSRLNSAQKSLPGWDFPTEWGNYLWSFFQMKSSERYRCFWRWGWLFFRNLRTYWTEHPWPFGADVCKLVWTVLFNHYQSLIWLGMWKLSCIRLTFQIGACLIKYTSCR